MMKKTKGKLQSERFLRLLKEGDERGLDYFYTNYYGYLFHRSLKATKDFCHSESIVQEAMLWLFRENLSCSDDVTSFLKTQVSGSLHTYFVSAKYRFHRRFLQMDGIEDYQDFLLPDETADEEPDYLLEIDTLEKEQQDQLSRIYALLPNMAPRQQLFIQLCLKHNFDYSRIASYLGGISDYEVAMQVERTLDTIRTVFMGHSKIELLTTSSRIVSEGALDSDQTEILRMRYELQLSFEQIADSLGLDSSTVRKIFVQAHASISSGKKSRQKIRTYERKWHDTNKKNPVTDRL
ncbi:sigma factor-like helix-turn-helix DNA-binding protein [Sphingobacterium griseoflavum]|uniref:RNA polymerase sigma-70 region 4 domain-containing protein n=1 Tax=Sphingobacterium griseoflavum TaxID=1474952 RepID=A0ABQ3HW27_9SPHI|nr:sigma factor-like helix-turn-helix DNA-binding protein [Sphingobacterium griseoflavum]GHE29098.1 hypothetical protein GCM10017764_09700 [Sphingobacterium griseoflavum]